MIWIKQRERFICLPTRGSATGFTKRPCQRWLRWIFIMPKYKVEFSDKTTTLPEHELDFPNVEAACKGARKIASKLRAAGMIMYGSNFSDCCKTLCCAAGEQ